MSVRIKQVISSGQVAQAGGSLTVVHVVVGLSPSTRDDTRDVTVTFFKPWMAKLFMLIQEANDCLNMMFY